MKRTNIFTQSIELNRKLMTFTSLHPLLDFVMDQVLLLTKFSQGVLVNFEKPAIPIMYISRGLNKNALDSPDYEGFREIVNRVVSTKKFIYRPKNRAELIIGRKISTLFCAPLTTKQEVLGFVYAHQESATKPLTNEAINVLNAFIFQAALAIENRILYDTNIKDPLLGIYNMDYFKKRLKEELQRCLRYRKPVALMIADIDDFKRINSILDYVGGNTVLQDVAEKIKSSIRSTDILARFGGDKFAVLLPETDYAAAFRAAGRLKSKVETASFGLGEKNLDLTISIGLIACGADTTRVAEDLIDDVNNTLLNAKKKGPGQITSLQKEPRKTEEETNLIGECQLMKNVIAMIDRLATVDATVLVTGETGTGKEVVARMIHLQSRRGNKPFVVVNCGAIPENLIESELFGHERGSFTGAYATQKGKFELASGGSIFLDEIGELPIHLQPKLLRALEEGKITRIGAKTPIPINVRIIAATNKNLELVVHENKFRKDLFYRLNVISLHLPALRDRGNDILYLADYFTRKYSKIYTKPIKEFTPEARVMMLNYHWPGNVRELAHLIERAVIMDQDGLICPIDLSLRPIFTKPLKLEDITSEVEKDVIRSALLKNRGNISKTSRELGITRVTLKKMLSRYGLKAQNFRTG